MYIHILLKTHNMNFSLLRQNLRRLIIGLVHTKWHILKEKQSHSSTCTLHAELGTCVWIPVELQADAVLRVWDKLLPFTEMHLSLESTQVLRFILMSDWYLISKPIKCVNNPMTFACLELSPPSSFTDLDFIQFLFNCVIFNLSMIKISGCLLLKTYYVIEI